MTLLGIIGIISAFFIVTFFTYKGMNLAYTVIIACLVVFLTNGLPVLQTFADPVFTGVASQIPTLLPLYLFGGIFGKLYLDSGASLNLSRTLLNVFARTNDVLSRRFIGFIIVVIINAAFSYVGVDPFATLFIMIGIATGVCFEADIPRRYLPVMLVLGTTMGSSIPGSQSAGNILCMNFLEGTNSLSAWIPGVVYCVLVLTASLVFIRRQLKRDTENSVSFDYGPLKPPVSVDEKHAPPFVLTLIPLILTPLCSNTICAGYAWAGMALGCLAAIICFGRYIPKTDGRGRIMTVIQSLNDGVTLAGVPAVIILNYALGYAIQAAPSFSTISDFFTSMSGPPLIILAIMGIVLLGVSASMSGLIVALGVTASVYIPVLGVNADAAYRVLLYTNTVLDTLPFNAAVVTLFAITGIKYKEGYPLVFATTVVFTFIGTMVVAGLLTIFPGLA